MIKFIIARGIGFSPGDVRYIPTFGFVAAASVSVSGPVLRFAPINGAPRALQPINADPRALAPIQDIG